MAWKYSGYDATSAWGISAEMPIITISGMNAEKYSSAGRIFAVQDLRMPSARLIE
jgi:hypothetical protein